LQPGGHRFDPGQLHQNTESSVVGYWWLAKSTGDGGRTDIILEILGELLLEPLAMTFSEMLNSGEWESSCRVQTLFGYDVWWNS
jgi:hypothetical protein